MPTVTLTINGYSQEKKYPVIELISALEDILEDLNEMTTPIEADQPVPLAKNYATSSGGLVLTLNTYTPAQEEAGLLEMGCVR